MPTAEEKIHQLLATYEQSLNTSDAALAADCYAPDGVFMPTTLPTASGAKLHAAYTQIFANIRLEVAFTVDELVVVSDRFAYALTRSNGTQTVLVSDTESREANREIFIFTRAESEWKISRYTFNKPE